MDHDHKKKRWQGKPVVLSFILVQISSMSNSCFSVFCFILVLVVGVSTSSFQSCKALGKLRNNNDAFGYGTWWIILVDIRLAMFGGKKWRRVNFSRLGRSSLCSEITGKWK